MRKEWTRIPRMLAPSRPSAIGAIHACIDIPRRVSLELPPITASPMNAVVTYLLAYSKSSHFSSVIYLLSKFICMLSPHQWPLQEAFAEDWLEPRQTDDAARGLLAEPEDRPTMSSALNAADNVRKAILAFTVTPIP